MECEVWKSVKGFDGKYLVSNMGNVISKHFGSVNKLKPSLNKKRGYVYINLQNKNKRRNYQIHRLVAEMFLKNELNLPQIDHIDNNKLNNKLSNLQWINNSDNVIKSIANGRKSIRGNLSGQSKLNNQDVLNMYNMFHNGVSKKDISIKYGIKQCSVSLILSGKRWGHIGRVRSDIFN